MHKPFFSVIIPTLNEENYLPRLLACLDKQTMTDFEVIVVDGGSEDQTAAIANLNYLHIKPRIFISTKRGVSHQRNVGASNTNGAYLVFFDADVQVSPKFLSAVHSQLLQTKSSFATTYLTPDSKIMQDMTFAILYNLTIEASLLIDRPFVPGFNFIVSEEAFKAVGGFDEKIVFAEDYDLAKRLHSQGFYLRLMRRPHLTFSLRRQRAEGRLEVIRKNITATLHINTKGPITKDIFSYPMGGGWYKTFKKKKRTKGLAAVEVYVKKFARLIFE